MSIKKSLSLAGDAELEALALRLRETAKAESKRRGELCPHELKSFNLSALVHEVPPPTRKVDRRLPGKGNSSSHGARPVY